MNIEAFFKLTYGLYIVSSRDGKRINGHVSNTVFQVTAQPPQIAIATHKNNLTTEFIRKSKVFAISVLNKEVDLSFLGPWGFKSGREVNKFDQVEYKFGKSGAPIVLSKCIAWFDCELVQEIDTGTHIIFIGRVVDNDLIQPLEKPLTYDYYREVIKGVSPENSPTYLGGYEKQSSSIDDSTPPKSMRKYRCRVCGYVYDPEQGDPAAGIPPGTPFEEIPENWTCPICGVTKSDFDPL